MSGNGGCRTATFGTSGGRIPDWAGWPIATTGRCVRLLFVSTSPTASYIVRQGSFTWVYLDVNEACDKRALLTDVFGETRGVATLDVSIDRRAS